MKAAILLALILGVWAGPALADDCVRCETDVINYDCTGTAKCRKNECADGCGLGFRDVISVNCAFVTGVVHCKMLYETMSSLRCRGYNGSGQLVVEYFEECKW
jgi:hypothetical protein